MIRDKDVKILILTETRVSGSKANKIIRRLGFNTWLRLEATGYAGGIWVLWNIEDLMIEYISSSTQAIHVKVVVNNEATEFVLSCIYAEPTCILRQPLWDEITNMSYRIAIPWLVVGDFNAYLYSDDKRGGSSPNLSSMRQFQDCISRARLIETDIVGERFTWERGTLKEKIDWAFMNSEWNLLQPLTKTYHLSRFGSDHRPILVIPSPSQSPCRGKPSFRCQAAWFLEDGFGDLVSQSWCRGSWNDKVKNFSIEAHEWNARNVGNLNGKKRRIIQRIEGIERARARRDTQHLIQTENELWKEYNKVLAQEELLWYQKSRCNWLKWGDKNSKFFHTTAMIRRRRNRIDGLKNNEGTWNFDQVFLRSMAINYYKDLFKSELTSFNPIDTQNCFPALTSSELAKINADLSREEIKEATFDLGAFKAPGPDGLQAVFYQEYWSTLEVHINDLVMGVFHEPERIEDINNTNIVLIPKVENPETIRDFRPISLCNVSYKIITKILSRRLRDIMGKVVGDHQCSFIAGRQSTDNIIVAQEVIHSMKTKAGRKGWMAVKVDLEKAYDRLEWPFIYDTLRSVGVDGKICQIIMACISSPSFQILWNGEATKSFKSSRGIRQGDPLSPYIFTLCMERLSHIIQDAIDAGEWVPIKLSRNGPNISHLFFADDLILFGEASDSQTEVMIDCLQRFCNISGQKMNKDKTRVCFSRKVNFSRAYDLSQKMGVCLTGDLGKYLGIPLIHKRMSKFTFMPLLERTLKKISGWKKGCLSFAGRITLIKSVLSALPSYQMQTLLIPKGVLQEMERKSRKVLWDEQDDQKKLHLIAWDQITRDKKEGGLGIRDLCKQNEAFIMKLCWHVMNNTNKLWVRVLREKYRWDQINGPVARSNMSATWRGICSVWDKFHRGVGVRVSNGASTSFWNDNWSQMNQPLIELVPGWEAFVDRTETVRHYVNPEGEWDMYKLGRWFSSHVVQQITCAQPPGDSRGTDKYFWKPSSDGCFSVSSAYQFLSAGPSSSNTTFWRLLWRWDIPEKIKSFMWLVAHGRVHTADLRARRGLSETASCPFLCEQDENLMHLLRDCDNARERWVSIIKPTMWNNFINLQGMEWIEWNLRHEAGREFTKKIRWATLFGYVCWDIWVSRCRKLFGDDAEADYTNAYSSFFRASWDMDLSSQCKFYTQAGRGDRSQQLRRPGFNTLETDGSVLQSGQSASAGVIRGEHGEWICGFMGKLIQVPPVVAEIIAIIQGLQICWNRNLKNIELFTDCIEAIQLLMRGCDVLHPFKEVIEEARFWLSRDWCVLINHFSREHNVEADLLARTAHSSRENFVIFNHPPPALLVGGS